MQKRHSKMTWKINAKDNCSKLLFTNAMRNVSPIILTQDRPTFQELISFTPVRQQRLHQQVRRARKRSILRASKKLRFTVYQREYRRAASGRSALPPTATTFSSRIICRRHTAAVIAYITIRWTRLILVDQWKPLQRTASKQTRSGDLCNFMYLQHGVVKKIFLDPNDAMRRINLADK